MNQGLSKLFAKSLPDHKERRRIRKAYIRSDGITKQKAREGMKQWVTTKKVQEKDEKLSLDR